MTVVASDPVAEPGRRTSRYASLLAATGVDQAVYSLNNLALSAVVLSSAGLTGLGQFSIGFGVYSLGLAVQRAGLVDPAVVGASEQRNRHLAGAQVILGVGVSVLLLLGGRVLGVGADTQVFFLAWVPLLAQDFARALALSWGRAREALVGDLMVSVSLVAAWAAAGTPAQTVALWAVGNALGWFFLLARGVARPTLDRVGMSETARGSRALALTSTVDQALQQSLMLVGIPLVLAAQGLAEAGAWRLTNMLYGPLALALTTVNTVAFPLVVRSSRPRRTAVLVALGQSVAVLGYAGVLLTGYAVWQGGLDAGRSTAVSWAALAGVGTAFAAYAWSACGGMVIRLGERPQRMLIPRLLSMVPILWCIAMSLLGQGETASVYLAFPVSAAVQAIGSWWQLRGAE